MSDQITSVVQREDGSWAFSFTFDNGEGVLGTITVSLPAPTEGQQAYTFDTAKEAVIPLARDQKTAWLQTLGQTSILGPVTL